MGRVTLFEERHESAIGARVEPARVRVKTVALPTEHGGWGLSLEPVVLGLLVAPSWPGLFLSVATMGAFLARHPFKIVAGDRRRGRRFPRTPIAERFVLLYGGLAALGLMAAFKAAASGEFLLPLLLAAPLASIQLFYDGRGRGRELLPEVAGSIAMASVAAAVALAGGWSRPTAFGLWLLLAARVVPTILFVRARLRQLHGRAARPAPVVLAHVIALALVLASVLANVVPALAVAAFLVLLLRAFRGFSERKVVTAKRIGVRELVFGAMTVLAAALGHYLA
jgi:hypothetical protein